MKHCTVKDWPMYTLYEDGRLYSQPRQGGGGWLNISISDKGYPTFYLRDNGRFRRVNLHKLLAEHFIPNPDNKPCVCHKDDDKMNWSLDNLYWGDQSDNNYDSWNNTRKRKTYTFMTDYGVEVTTSNLPLWCKEHGVKLRTVQKSHERGSLVYLKKHGILLRNTMDMNESTQSAAI